MNNSNREYHAATIIGTTPEYVTMQKYLRAIKLLKEVYLCDGFIPDQLCEEVEKMIEQAKVYIVS
jgi:NADH:ubiquinone oxidoreductase subunit E